ncbi:MAG: thiamine phosphate synthase [Tissierellia bacterium]|nr:thiamine phosphate synthase [Tissierellia bacterium]
MKLNKESLKKSLLLYAITDSNMIGNSTLSEKVEEAILGGATMIQLREKNISKEKYLALAKEVKEITDKYNIPLIIDDEIDVALACNAEGVHVGQKDMDAATARRKIGPHKILGVSAETVEQALLAEKAGADYLGVGSMFPTSTKSDANLVSIEALKAICNAVKIPVVAIGGISKENISRLKDSGIVGVSIVSAIFGQEDVKEATGILLAEVEKYLK